MTQKKIRTKFIPKIKVIYVNAGGGKYKCLSVYDDDYSAIMQNVASGWTFVAHGIGRYEDGSIDWDFSTGGHFAQEVTA